MKKEIRLLLVVLALFGIGIILAINAFSDGGLNILGLSFVTGWCFAVVALAALVLPIMARWATPSAVLAIFLGVYFPTKLFEVINWFWHLVQSVEPIGFSAGAGAVTLYTAQYGCARHVQFARFKQQPLIKRAVIMPQVFAYINPQKFAFFFVKHNAPLLNQL